MVQKEMSPEGTKSKKEQNQNDNINIVMKRTSRGRQKIEIKRIENDAARQVTLSKRRKGLFKKGAEFSILTGTEVAIITRTESGKISAFGYPDIDSVIDRYLNRPQSAPSTLINAEMLDEDRRLSSELEAEKRKLEAQKNSNVVNNYWWYEPMDNLGLEELEQCLSSLIQLRANLIGISGEQNSRSPAALFDDQYNTQYMGVEDNVKMEQTVKTDDLDLLELHSQSLSKVEMEQTETINSDDMDLLEYYESMGNDDLDVTINIDDLFEGSQTQKDSNNVNFTALINCVEDDTVESQLGFNFCFSPEDCQSFCSDPCR